MSYVKPEDVKAPKGWLADPKILHNAGEWSLAEFTWDSNEEEKSLGLRWNGSNDESSHISSFPQSSGHPVWFVVPEALENALRLHLGLKR